MMKQPNGTGWFWFLPDENCATPTGLIRVDRPVIVLVGQSDVLSRAGKPSLVVRFSTHTELCSDLTGDWHPAKPPKSMQKKAMQRIKEKHQQ